VSEDEAPEGPPATPKEHATGGLIDCRRCGALNEPGFGSCIRCGEALRRARASAIVARKRPSHKPQITAKLDPSGRFSGSRLPATKFFLGLTLLVYGGQLISVLEREAWGSLLMGANIVDDLRFGAMLINPAIDMVAPMTVLETEPWRTLSSVFVHFGFIHFAVNMFALVQLARLAEPAIGSVRFVIAYVTSGVAGFALTVVYVGYTGDTTFTAGASGAIFGVMGVILGFLVRRRDPRWKTWAVQAVFYSLLFGVMLKANNAAHVGGLIFGAVLGALFAPGAPKPATRWQEALAIACLAACVISLVLAQLSPLWRIAESQISG
jgi:membrane associated rhomboid family serine protease